MCKGILNYSDAPHSSFILRGGRSGTVLEANVVHNKSILASFGSMTYKKPQNTGSWIYVLSPVEKRSTHTDLKMQISRLSLGHFKLEDIYVFVGHVPPTTPTPCGSRTVYPTRRKSEFVSRTPPRNRIALFEFPKQSLAHVCTSRLKPNGVFAGFRSGRYIGLPASATRYVSRCCVGQV